MVEKRIEKEAPEGANTGVLEVFLAIKQRRSVKRKVNILEHTILLEAELVQKHNLRAVRFPGHELLFVYEHAVQRVFEDDSVTSSVQSHLSM